MKPSIAFRFFLLLILLASASFAQTPFWQQLNLPSGGSVVSMGILPTGEIFAGTNCGMYRSADNGEHWSAVRTGLTDQYIQRILVMSSGEILAGTRDGLFRSTDKGDSWSRKGLAGLSVRSIARNTAGHLLVAAGLGLHRSTDDGATWTNVRGSMPGDYIYCAAIHPGGALFAGAWNSGMYRSTDNGNSWNKTANGMSADKFYTIFINVAGDIFTGTYGMGIFRSTDAGNTWTQKNAGIGYLYPYCIEADQAGKLYTGVHLRGIYVSTNNGDTWSTLSPDISSEIVNAIALRQGGSMFFGCTDGVWRSDNGGLKWTKTKNGINAAAVYAMTAPSSSTFIAGVNDGAIRSTDNGATWTGPDTVILSDVLVLSSPIPGRSYAGSDSRSIWRSTDEGANWTRLGSIPSGSITALIFPGPGLLFVASRGGGVFRSTDGGATLTPVTTGLGDLNVRALANDENGKLYAATDGGLFSSSSNGDLWSEISTGSSGTSFMGVLTGANAKVYAVTDGGIFCRSTDRGASWTAAGTGVNDWVNCMIRASGGQIFLGMNETGTLMSIDEGLNWQILNSGMYYRDVTALFPATDGSVYACTYGGLYRGIPVTNQPSVSCTPGSVDFGVKYVGAAGFAEIRIENKGGADLTLSGYAIAGGDPSAFTIIRPGPSILAPGGRDSIRVRFYKTTKGVFTSELQFQTNDPLQPTVHIPLRGETVGPVLVTDAALIDFGVRYAGADTTRSLMISNTGGGPLIITNFTIAGADPNDFSLPGISPDYTIDPAGARFISIRFRPQGAGAKSAALTFTSNDPDKQSVSIDLRGSGKTRAQMLVWQAAIDFGNVLINATSAKPLVIGNGGTDTLHIRSTLIAGPDMADFTVQGTVPQFVPGLDSVRIMIGFTPLSAGAKNAAFHLATDDPVNPATAVDLSGNAVTTDVDAANLPFSCSLAQNYPNPFSSSTSIEFTMNRSGRVRLIIRDLFGREVATIVNGELSPGAHTAAWNAAGLPPGMYQCLLTDGSVSATRRMQLLK